MNSYGLWALGSANKGNEIQMPWLSPGSGARVCEPHVEIQPRSLVVNVLMFSRVRNSRDAPDAAFVTTDGDERKLYRFALQYDMDGKSWATEIWAYSSKDAEERVAAMRGSLTMCGQLYGEVEA
ncbi:hypothetical protein RCCGE510_31716 (plasmid) [Rhizobium sp. CCGE 510]|nr:hypothetical protein RCCGE510_31716 [Rhizobium sp. CCGE 510]